MDILFVDPSGEVVESSQDIVHAGCRFVRDLIRRDVRDDDIDQKGEGADDEGRGGRRSYNFV